MNHRQWLAASCAVCAFGSATAAFAQAAPSADQKAAQQQKGASRSDAGQRAAATNQDTDAGSAAAVGEVVVTASRRAETVQHVPAAITAFTDERRNLLGIENGRDITFLTPSMSLQGEFLSLRGVGRFELPGVGVDPGVAVHVDGVYTSSPAYLGQPDFLTDRIEVLRGPQSIFGRNSLGGTVNVISKRPTADFHGDLRGGYTDRGFGYVDAAVSGPITDTLRFRTGFSDSDTNEGVQKNIGGKSPGEGDTRLYEAQLEWDATPDINIWARYQNFSDTFRDAYGVGGVGLSTPYLTGAAANFYTLTIYGLAPNPQFGIPGSANPSATNLRTINVDDVGGDAIKNDHTFTINATWDLHAAKLKYVGGYSQYDYLDTSDADRTSNKYITSPDGRQVPSEFTFNTLQRKKWSSHELILSSPDDQRLRLVGGLYYYTERYKTDFDLRDVLSAAVASPLVASGPGSALAAPDPTRSIYSQETALRSDNEAAYAQVDFDLTPTIQLTGAIRGNFDQKYGSARLLREVYDLYGFYGDYGEGAHGLDLLAGATPPKQPGDQAKDFQDWSGKVEAEWHPDRTTTAYITIAKGYKPGGFNLNGSLSPVPTVAPETLIDYEAGYKKTFGRTLVVDGALFYYDYTGLQVPITVGTPAPSVTNPVTGVTTPGSGLIYVGTLGNAQKAHSIGFELETVWSPLDNLHFTLVYSYLDAVFDKFTSPTAGGVIRDNYGVAGAPTDYSNLKGNTIPQSPRNKVAFIPQYTVHLPGSDLSLSATYAWTDQQYYAIFNTPRYSAPSYSNLDLRAVFQPTKSRWTVLAYARNVTDANELIYVGPYGDISGVPNLAQVYTLAERRSFGFELQYRF